MWYVFSCSALTVNIRGVIVQEKLINISLFFSLLYGDYLFSQTSRTALVCHPLMNHISLTVLKYSVEKSIYST